MITPHRSLVALIVMFFSLGTVVAQTSSRPLPSSPLPETPTVTQILTPIVTATASTDRVRYAALGEVNHTRLQVFSPQGSQVFDSNFRLGNVVDWHLRDQQSSFLQDGTYLFLVTVKDFSNNLTQRYGTATLEEGQVFLEQNVRTELSQAQALALETNQLAATPSPVDRIGAAGSIRTTASGPNDATTASTPDAAGTTENPDLVAGTGTQNKIAKWIDGAGTLGDSVMYDNGTGVGVGTTDLSDVLVAGNDKFKIVDGAMTFSFRDFSTGQGYFAVGSGANGIKGYVGHTNTVDGFTLGTFTNHKLTIRTNSVNRLVIDTSGRVGIGTTSPINGTLDVVGNINTSTHYSIDGYRVLTTTGVTENTFGGVRAGEANTTGEENTFFGDTAGRLNTTGDYNSFFGVEAGYYNNTGGSNSFFGRLAGRDNTEGGRNAFFGAQSGYFSLEGSGNAFFGFNTGIINRTGSYNTLIGSYTDVGTTDLQYATAIGARATVSNNDRIVIGKIAGTYDGVVRPADTVRIPGDLIVVGSVSKGSGSFKIDYPLDPLNKTLSHSFVESPDMMNVYNGNVTTNARGLATVILPDYFEALNRDFRYQLTVIGKFAQAIVLEEIEGNQFLIKTSKPRVKVSWQVTGIRQDAYAEANRVPTVELKPEAERGAYLHPEAFASKPTAGRKVSGAPGAEGGRRPARN